MSFFSSFEQDEYKKLSKSIRALISCNFAQFLTTASPPGFENHVRTAAHPEGNRRKSGFIDHFKIF